MKKAAPNPAPGRKALGRGLSALLPTRRPEASPNAVPEAAGEPSGERIELLSPDLIDPNPDQPRRIFDVQAIEELAQSIRSDGVIQPIVVRPVADRFTIVVGERRWRAAKIAGLDAIPAIIRDVEQERILEIALIENVQRENLNPIETAVALRRLGEELQLSHEELARRTGKDRTTITNLLRLLKLAGDVQTLVAEGKLSMGHARCLLALPDEESQRRFAARVLERELSVRETEKLVREALEPPPPPRDPKRPDPNIAAAVEELERALGAPVRLVPRGPKRGRIEIDYSSPEDLDRLYGLLTGG